MDCLFLGLEFLLLLHTHHPSSPLSFIYDNGSSRSTFVQEKNDSTSLAHVNAMTRQNRKLGSGMVVIPQDFDVILGRGNACASHPGNVHYTRLIEAHALEYGSITTKKEKSDLIPNIYERVLTFGQFLRDDKTSENGLCIVVEDHKAKSKIGHALRYRYAQIFGTKARQKHESQQNRNAERGLLVSDHKSELFNDDELDSVLGYPGEFHYPPASDVIDCLD